MTLWPSTAHILDRIRLDRSSRRAEAWPAQFTPLSQTWTTFSSGVVNKQASPQNPIRLAHKKYIHFALGYYLAEVARKLFWLSSVDSSSAQVYTLGVEG